MKVEFSKKGFNFSVEVKGENAIVEVEDLSFELGWKDFSKHQERGWYYIIRSKELFSKLTGKEGDTVKLLHPSAEDVANKIEENREKRLDAEKNKELVFKVEEADLGSRAYNMTTPILVRKPKALSDEQREMTRKLRSLFGETAKFAGATKHIKARELNVEVGEEYTLSEIVELAKKTDRYQAQETKRQEADKKRDEAFKEARKTGKKVELGRMTVSCNGEVSECSTDIIIEYALPNGKTKTDRIHTY